MTTATAIARLPQGSRIIAFVLSGVASTAGTSATISIGSTSANSNEYVNAYDVKTAATGNGVNVLNGVAGAVGQVAVGPNGSEQVIYAKYAETGTPSGAGAWYVHIIYTTGEFTR
jgi:hypothetical protein